VLLRVTVGRVVDTYCQDVLAHSCGSSVRISLKPVEKLASEQWKPLVVPRFALAQNYPNPFNPFTQISFELAHRTRAGLRIYDPAGRLIRVLLDETLEPGPHAVIWDGRNDHGHAVSSGMYFYRLEAGGFIDTRQLVVLR
jgi:hypothetical protein